MLCCVEKDCFKITKIIIIIIVGIGTVGCDIPSACGISPVLVGFRTGLISLVHTRMCVASAYFLSEVLCWSKPCVCEMFLEL